MTRSDLPPMELRDEGLLRLGFGDHLGEEEALAMIGRLRERAEREALEFRQELMPMAAAAFEQGIRFPSLVARMGAEYHEWAAGFFAKVESEVTESMGTTQGQSGETAGDKRQHGAGAEAQADEHATG